MSNTDTAPRSIARRREVMGRVTFVAQCSEHSQSITQDGLSRRQAAALPTTDYCRQCQYNASRAERAAEQLDEQPAQLAAGATLRITRSTYRWTVVNVDGERIELTRTKAGKPQNRVVDAERIIPESVQA